MPSFATGTGCRGLMAIVYYQNHLFPGFEKQWKFVAEHERKIKLSNKGSAICHDLNQISIFTFIINSYAFGWGLGCYTHLWFRYCSYLNCQA